MATTSKAYQYKTPGILENPLKLTEVCKGYSDCEVADRRRRALKLLEDLDALYSDPALDAEARVHEPKGWAIRKSDGEPTYESITPQTVAKVIASLIALTTDEIDAIQATRTKRALSAALTKCSSDKSAA